MCLRKLDQEVSALAGVIFDHNGTLVIFDNAVCNRETQTRSCSDLFCGEEWVENTLFQTHRNTWTGITHTQFYALCLHSAGDGNDFMRHVGERVTRISQQVKNHLFHLNRVANHNHLFLREMHDYLYLA